MEGSKLFVRTSQRKSGYTLPLLLTVAFLAVVTSFCICPALNADASENDYDFDSGTGTIKGYRGPGGDVEIPRMIGGYPVTTIGEGAFVNCKNVTSLTIPDSVKTIGERAFLNCSGLTSVTIPTDDIGHHAFSFCNGLLKITFFTEITKIKLESILPGYLFTDLIGNQDHTVVGGIYERTDGINMKYTGMFGYDITFHPENGQSDFTVKTDPFGKIASMPSDPSRSGYEFDGWFTTYGVKVTPGTVFTEDTDVYAQWTSASDNGEQQKQTETIAICATVVAVLAILCVIAVMRRNRTNRVG